MPNRRVLIEEKTILFGEASNRTRLGKAINRLRDVTKSLIALDKNIYEIEEK